MQRAALRAGAAAAALVWIAFLVHGGVRGVEHEGTVLPLALFLVEALLFGYAGFRVRRSGLGAKESAQAGALAGLLAELLAGFWRTVLLFLNHGYMTWLQGAKNPGAALTQMPWPPLTVLAALVGAVLAGVAIGAAAGAIGGAFAQPPQSAA